MKYSWSTIATIGGFLAITVLGLWDSRVVWATPNQAPDRQTVPTKTFTPAYVPPTNTSIPPTHTPIPRTDTPLPPGVTAAPATPTVPASQTPPATAVSAEVMATAKENLRIRSAPSTNSAVIGQLRKGESARIVGRTNANDWWQIPLPANTNARGWIAAEFAPANGPVSAIPVGQGSVVPTAPPVPTLVVISTMQPVLATSTPTPRSETMLEPTETLPSSLTSVPVTNPSGPRMPIASVLIGVVLLGVGGGFVLVMVGVIVTLWKRM